MSYIVPRDKPQRCSECPYINLYNDCRLIRGSERIRTVEEQYQHCPLIEIHTPHGRLIDADALIADLVKYQNTLDPESRENARVLSVKSYLTLARGEAIIEAEEGE